MSSSDMVVYFVLINVIGYLWDNPKWTIQRNWYTRRRQTKTQHNLCIMINIGIGAFELFIYNVLYKLYCF